MNWILLAASLQTAVIILFDLLLKADSLTTDLALGAVFGAFIVTALVVSFCRMPGTDRFGEMYYWSVILRKKHRLRLGDAFRRPWIWFPRRPDPDLQDQFLQWYRAMLQLHLGALTAFTLALLRFLAGDFFGLF